MNRRIYLVRHGEIDCGEEKHYIGITDLPLNDKGRAQADRLKAYFSDIKIDKAYTSPLLRCVQTSEIILEGKTIEAIRVDELQEINLGKWEGKSFDYIKDRFPDQYKKRGMNIDCFIPPGGESFKQLQERVMPVFDEIIRSSDGNILIVAHAGVNRVIISKLMSFPLKDIMSLPQPYGCVNILFMDKTRQNWNYDTVL
jgi:probable phosphoglycerate mutase